MNHVWNFESEIAVGDPARRDGEGLIGQERFERGTEQHKGSGNQRSPDEVGHEMFPGSAQDMQALDVVVDPVIGPQEWEVVLGAMDPVSEKVRDNRGDDALCEPRK